MEIPDEAVEAAHEVFMRTGLGGTVREHMQRVLEAAAPHLMAVGWDEASSAIKSTIGGYAEEGVWAFEQAEKLNPNPYRSAGAGE